MQQKQNKVRRILGWIAFVVFYMWLLLLVTLGSTHKYDWMLDDSEFNQDRCRLHASMLDDDYNDQRKIAYVLFLVQLVIAGFIFIRKKNWAFMLSLSPVFIYASWLLIIREALC